MSPTLNGGEAPIGDCDLCDGTGVFKSVAGPGGVITTCVCACDVEPCWYCDKPIAENGVPVFDHHSEEMAHLDCKLNADEAAYDRSVEDFHGSSSPQTDRERGDAAYEQKRRLG